jgi:hypothetical protein
MYLLLATLKVLIRQIQRPFVPLNAEEADPYTGISNAGYILFPAFMSIIQFFKEYYTIFFVWFSGITVLIVYRRYWPLSYKVLGLFIVLYVLLDTAGSIMAAFYKIHNLFFYNIVYDIQVIVISYFFFHQLYSHFIKKVIRSFFFIFPLFALVNTIWWQGFFTWQTYSFVFGGSFIILLSVAYLWQLYISEETQSIFRDPVFWFSLAWILYFAITVPYFGMLNYLLKNFPDLALSYYILVIDISDCLRNILLTIGFLCIQVVKK